MNGYEHGWGMGFGWLLPMMIIAALYYLISNKKTDKPSGRSSAQDILDRRYASGGISKEEYDKKSKHLRDYA